MIWLRTQVIQMPEEETPNDAIAITNKQRSKNPRSIMNVEHKLEHFPCVVGHFFISTTVFFLRIQFYIITTSALSVIIQLKTETEVFSTKKKISRYSRYS